jgi:outer membrane biogenesis lipoprotein LolB
MVHIPAAARMLSWLMHVQSVRLSLLLNGCAGTRKERKKGYLDNAQEWKGEEQTITTVTS